MHDEFTAVFAREGEWYIAYSPEIGGANGQGAEGRSPEDRRDDGLRGMPPDGERETLIVK
jgi:hypothetical protein